MSLSGLDQQVYQYMEGTGALQPASNPRTDRERGIDNQGILDDFMNRNKSPNPRGITRSKRPEDIFENPLARQEPETMEDFLRLRYEQELFEHQFRGAEKTPFMRGYEEKYLPKMENLPFVPQGDDLQNFQQQLLPSPIDEGIQELQMQLMSTEDPDEKQMLSRMIENIESSANAPLADFAKTVQEAGTNEDTVLAHLSPGEVVLPAQMFEDDPEFENLIEKKFQSYGIQPETAIAGTGIAALNPATGLEEFGFFKKIGKALKKVIRPIAKVAQFIPGPWQPIAAIADKALTVYDVAKGKQSPLALASLAMPIPKAGKIGSGGGIRGLLGKTKEYILPGADDKGLFKNIGQSYRSRFGGDRGNQFSMLRDAGMSRQEIRELERQGVSVEDQYNQLMGSPAMVGGQQYGTIGEQLSMQDKLQAIQRSGMQQSTFDDLLNSGSTLDDVFQMATASQGGGGAGQGGAGQGGSLLQRLGLRQDQPGQSALGRIEDILKGRPSDPVRQGGGLDSLLGQAGGGRLGGNLLGGGGISGLMAAGIPAYLLGKMAMDEARTRKGVPLTPLTTMDPVGRYNIEAEIARRMGGAQPNPVEFGLMPQGTFPELSGSRNPETTGGRNAPAISRYVDDFRNMNQGGTVYPMAYAEGGNVAMEDFERMNGVINGEGTETSDDIPAMLSDGEFVMTGQAVRGAGTYEIENKGGIISLIPSAQESRERGTQNMYSLMSAFENQAGAS